MGNAFSTIQKTDHRTGFSLQMFKKESDIVNDLLNKILTKENDFFDPELNLTSNEMCKDYIFVLENSLQKHLKVELKDLNQNILLIPNGENQAVKKAELCTLVTEHYKSMLQVILLIKNVYDLEHVGNNSILGICVQLVKIDKDTFTIYYCDGPQGKKKQDDGNDMSNSKSGKTSSKSTKSKTKKQEEIAIDLRELKGLQMLFDHFLDVSERKILVQNFVDVLQYNDTKDGHEQQLPTSTKLPPYDMELNLKAKRNRTKYVDAMLCGDSLMTQEQYKNLFANQASSVPERTCNKVNAFNRRKQYESLKDTSVISIQGRNPIFAPYCSSQRAHTIDFSKVSAAQASQLKQMYAVMRQDYADNMNVVYSLLKEIVVYEKDRNCYTIKHLSVQSLDKIRMKVKRLVVQFYLRSLMNYQNILDFALSV